MTLDELQTRLDAAQPIILGYGTLDGKDTDANSDLARSFVPGPRYGGKTKQIVADVAKLHARRRRRGLAHAPGRPPASLAADADIIAHVQSDLVAPPAPGA